MPMIDFDEKESNGAQNVGDLHKMMSIALSLPPIFGFYLNISKKIYFSFTII